MEINEKTKLTDIMAAYPELTKKLLQDEKIAALVSSPMAKLMLKRATIRDAALFSGEPVQDLIDELNRLILLEESKNS